MDPLRAAQQFHRNGPKPALLSFYWTLTRTFPIISSMSSDECRKKTVLIVDDAPFMVSEMEEVLLPYFDVRSARSGLDALEIARKEPCPDLILLDVVLPDIDGHGVISRLKSDARTARIPVIFVTAADAVDDIERGLCGGAVDYITKPLVVDDLVNRCQHVLASLSPA